MASELRRTVVFKFMLNGPGVVIVVCSPGYRSSSIVVFNFISLVICIVKISFFGYKNKLSRHGRNNIPSLIYLSFLKLHFALEFARRFHAIVGGKTVFILNFMIERLLECPLPVDEKIF